MCRSSPFVGFSREGLWALLGLCGELIAADTDSLWIFDHKMAFFCKVEFVNSPYGRSLVMAFGDIPPIYWCPAENPRHCRKTFL